MTGEYLEKNRTWHAEDSAWKARQILRILGKNEIKPNTITEIGCGSGQILEELAREASLENCEFRGYDISPQAIDLCGKRQTGNVAFSKRDILAEDNADHFDLLLVIDVFEHVPDYMGFVEKCRLKANYKVYHIPLDIHVSSVLRGSFVRGRYHLGHLHYFTADSAIATLRDTGHEIVDFFYTSHALALFGKHPSLNRAIANGPRWLLSQLSVPLAARTLGGYSVLALTK